MTTAEYIPKYFRSHELLPECIWSLTGNGGLRLFDSHVLRSLDAIRDYLGKSIYINTYLKDGEDGFDQSGLREISSKTGKPLSRHKFGQAFDLKCGTDADLEALRDLILKHGRSFRIARMEDLSVTMPKKYIHVEFADKMTHMVDVFFP